MRAGRSFSSRQMSQCVDHDSKSPQFQHQIKPCAYQLQEIPFSVPQPLAYEALCILEPDLQWSGIQSVFKLPTCTELPLPRRQFLLTASLINTLLKRITSPLTPHYGHYLMSLVETYTHSSFHCSTGPISISNHFY